MRIRVCFYHTNVCQVEKEATKRTKIEEREVRREVTFRIIIITSIRQLFIRANEDLRWRSKKLDVPRYERNSHTLHITRKTESDETVSSVMCGDGGVGDEQRRSVNECTKMQS